MFLSAAFLLSSKHVCNFEITSICHSGGQPGEGTGKPKEAEAVHWASPCAYCRRASGEGKEEILEDLGSHLVSLATKNKISATEASTLVNKCRRGGINIKGPFKPAEGNLKKRAIWGFKEEPGDGTAAKSLTRWLKRENKWAPLYWADIPLWNNKKSCHHTHSYCHMIGWSSASCRKVPAKKDSLKKAAFMRRS